MLNHVRIRAWCCLVTAAALCLLAFSAMALAETARIGFIGPLSGGWGFVGQQQLDGAKLAVSEYKRRGGQPEVELMISDDSCSAPLSAEKARRAFKHDRAVIIVGAPCGAATSLVATVAAEVGGVFLSTSSVTDAGALQTASGSDTFQLGPSWLQAMQFAGDLSRQTGQRVAVGKTCFMSYAFDITSVSTSDAEICPVLHASQTAWKSFKAAYASFSSAASHSKAEPDAHTLLGYVATQIALQALAKAGSDSRRVAQELRSGSFDTALGIVRPGQPNPLGALLVVVPNPGIANPKGEALKSATTSIANLKGVALKSAKTNKKTCDVCATNAECPQTGSSALTFAASAGDCCQSSECPQGSMLLLR